MESPSRFVHGTGLPTYQEVGGDVLLVAGVIADVQRQQNGHFPWEQALLANRSGWRINGQVWYLDRAALVDAFTLGAVIGYIS